MASNLWIKEVENPALKPLDQWRKELYGYWMVATDTDYDERDGIKRATARVKYYGTDKDKLYDLWDELCHATEKADVGIYHNVRSQWLGLLFNSNRFAFREFQAGMAGEAEKAGIKDEQDVLDIVKQVRGQMWGERNANNG